MNKKKEQLRRKIKSRPKSRIKTKANKRIGLKRPGMKNPEKTAMKAAEAGPGGERGSQPDASPENMDIMSKVIYDFAAPLLQTCEGPASEKKAISLAIFVWNATLLPEEEQRQTLGAYLSECRRAIPPDEFKILSSRIDQLVESKKTHFAGNRNKITNCTFGDFGGNRHLEVGYTLA